MIVYIQIIKHAVTQHVFGLLYCGSSVSIMGGGQRFGSYDSYFEKGTCSMPMPREILALGEDAERVSFCPYLVPMPREGSNISSII
jgi:hypothetical protein